MGSESMHTLWGGAWVTKVKHTQVMSMPSEGWESSLVGRPGTKVGCRPSPSFYISLLKFLTCLPQEQSRPLSESS